MSLVYCLSQRHREHRGDFIKTGQLFSLCIQTFLRALCASVRNNNNISLKIALTSIVATLSPLFEITTSTNSARCWKM